MPITPTQRVPSAGPGPCGREVGKVNAETLKRLVRAVADGSQSDLERLVSKVIEAEKRSGHTRLASELEAILARRMTAGTGLSGPRTDTARPLQELPVSRRHRDTLAHMVPCEALEHHMVLPPVVENRFQRIEREFAARDRLAEFGLRPRRTILLYGPPGCGKSLGAKRLAWNTGLPLLKVRFDALLSSYFGESATNLRSVFDSAHERPCVLLLDECDFIARSRVNSRDVGEASRIVNSLLQLMEDYEAPGLLVATTNIEHSLDEALFRRFDEVLHIPQPGSEEIDQLLKLTLSGVALRGKIRWPELVDSLQGQSAAMIVKAAQDAAKSALLLGDRAVSEDHLKTAISELQQISSR